MIVALRPAVQIRMKLLLIFDRMFRMYSTLTVIILGSVLIIQGSEEASAQIIHITGTNISKLHQYLDNSHHQPLCVVFKTGSQLERKVVKLWLASDQVSSCHLSSWVLAAVNSAQVRRLPGYLLKGGDSPQSPVLRCFLGPIMFHDLDTMGPLTTKQLQKWFCQLVAQHDQLLRGSVDLIEASVHQHRFTLLVFPTVQQHQQLEQTAFQVAEQLSKECKVNTIVIHPSSTNLKDIMGKYKVFQVPSVLLIEKESGMEQEQTLFNIHEVMRGNMETNLRARLIPAPQFTFSGFEAEVLRVMPGKPYTPYVIGLYAHWEQGSAVFLSFLLHTVLEFRSLGAHVRFGLVDAARNPEVVSHHMSPMCLQHLPFLAIFHAEEGQLTVNQTELLITRPTPYTVYSALQEAGLALKDSNQQPISYQPYGQDTQVCLWNEGPDGSYCSSDNTTWLFDAEFMANSLNSQPTQDTANSGKEAEKMEKIPVATPSDWHSMGQPSDGDGEHASVSIHIFIFIRYPCKSCEESHPVFQHIYQQCSFKDSYRVLLVNCSQTSAPCEQHHVTGFPTLLAFRRHTPSVSCDTGGATRPQPAPAVRQDYHGVLTATALMEWINSVSASAVQSVRFSSPQWASEALSAQLVATVVPVDSGFLPLPPHRDRGYFYSMACFRELCERLFGLVACITVYSSQLPPSLYRNHQQHWAVTQVEFQRRDGVQVTVMQLGQSLVDLLEQETESAVHMFHTHHSYNLRRKQKCEEGHGDCTTFMESFARDHLRLPVTPLTSQLLHSHNEVLFGKKVPVLLALVEADYSPEFHEVLQSVAYTFYKEVIVATLDVSVHPVWAGSFVPRNYNQLHAERPSWGELSLYPRLVLFYWQDHTKAAFYPPVHSLTSQLASQQSTASTTSSQHLTEDLIAGFVQHFLNDPASNLIETERF